MRRRIRTLVAHTVHTHAPGQWCHVHALPHTDVVHVWFLWPSGVSGPTIVHHCDED